MLFNSPGFLFVFLPAVLAGYYLLWYGTNARLWFLIAASLFFYGYWDWRFEPLLIASIVVNWGVVQLYLRWQHPAILGVLIALDLLCLAGFKYAAFFGVIVEHSTGLQLGLIQILPLGISFFTFHHIIYIVDLWRGRAPVYRFRDYTLYIALFPQIIAGPIVRHNEIIHQFALSPWRDGLGIRWAQGLTLVAIGLGKKMLLADALAPVADHAFAIAALGPLGILDAWLGVLSFTFQIYFDFSGYSDMAIGLTLLLGFQLPVNFNAPYRAVSISDFWRRWHITLSRFLRDYLYIPLGGNRHGPSVQVAALLITMSLAGLWHGAGWTFVIWGALHGFALSVRALFRGRLEWLPSIVGWALTFLFVTVSWVFFRAADIGAATMMLNAMAGQINLPGHVLPMFAINWIMVAVAAGVAVIGPTSQELVEGEPRPWLGYAVGASAVFILLKVASVPVEPFIYFRF